MTTLPLASKIDSPRNNACWEPAAQPAWKLLKTWQLAACFASRLAHDYVLFSQTLCQPNGAVDEPAVAWVVRGEQKHLFWTAPLTFIATPPPRAWPVLEPEWWVIPLPVGKDWSGGGMGGRPRSTPEVDAAGVALARTPHPDNGPPCSHRDHTRPRGKGNTKIVDRRALFSRLIIVAAANQLTIKAAAFQKEQ